MTIGLKRGSVKLVEHDPHWADEFVREVARLKNILPAEIGPFEHVGSTSIPGIPAKPIIDFIVGVANVGIGCDLKESLAEAGYEHRPNGDNADRMLFVRGPEDRRTHHFSLVTLGSSQWRSSLGFRDALCNDPLLASRYAKLKRELEAKYPEDRASYTREKEPFFREVFEIVALKGNN